MVDSKRDLIDACVYIDEEDHTYRVQLSQRKTLIGNTKDCDILVKDRRAGNFQGEFIATRRGFEFRSRGGGSITLNGHPISGTQRLHHGDVLTISSTKVRYFEVPEVSNVTLQFGISGLNSGHSFFLTNQSFVRIGNTVGELRIPDDRIGNPQVALENLGSGSTYIQQLSSECPTRVDGNPLRERTALKDGSVIEMGETHIVIRTIRDVPLPAPSEALLKSADMEKNARKTDQKQTAPNEVKIAPKARIRSGKDAVITPSNSASDGEGSAHDMATVDLASAVPPGTIEALREARRAGLTRSPSSQKGNPTPQPYTLRSDAIAEAKKRYGGQENPYYLQPDNERKASPTTAASAKPYYLHDGHQEEPEAEDISSHPTQAPRASQEPYYMPQTGSKHRPDEKNSPLDWMEGQPSKPTEEAQAGATVVLSRDAVDSALAAKKKYYVPDEKASRRKTPIRRKTEEKAPPEPDRSGITMQDTPLEELD
jgi:pSer/pThr/pTyr-binding forkhead associated (FHA) protein